MCAEALLSNFPDATVNVVEFLLENRADVDKKDVHDVLHICQQIWSAHHGGALASPDAPAHAAFSTNLKPMPADPADSEPHIVRAVKKKKKFFTELLNQVVDLS